MSKEKKFPRHGTRSRYRRLNCRCIACQRGAHGKPIPDELRWSLSWVEKKFGKDCVAYWFSPEQVAEWRNNGLTDAEADRVVIQLGSMPHFVFPGWTSSGLDFDQYP